MENQLEKTFHKLKTLGNYNVYKILNDVIPSLSSLLPLDNEWEVQWVYIPVFQGGLVDSLLYHDSITVFFFNRAFIKNSCHIFLQDNSPINMKVKSS